MDGRPVDRYLHALRERLPELTEEFHVRSLEVFGSYVRNEQTPESDLDVLVTFEQAPGLFEFVELRDRLSDVLGVTVDLVMKTALKPRLKHGRAPTSPPALRNSALIPYHAMSSTAPAR